ncbi:hypothetical protein TNCV_5038291 [Trichonephila clavipes]|nr:hypothetical protein TNCV_5038291 [Trichonephila clavipes]
MKNEEPIHIPDFNFVASYKRPEVPAAGVAIYQHAQDTSHIVTSYMDIHTKFTRGIVPRQPSGQGIGSWLACPEFKPSTTKDPPCRETMHIKSVESLNVLPLRVVRRGSSSSSVVLDHSSKLRGLSLKALM